MILNDFRNGEEDIILPNNYYFQNDKLVRTVESDNGRIFYTYDENGLLEEKQGPDGFRVDSTLYNPHGSFTGKKEGAKLSTLQRLGVTGLALMALAGAIYLPKLVPPKIEHREWQEFKAKYGNYDVDIDISAYGDNYTNITYLTQVSLVI